MAFNLIEEDHCETRGQCADDSRTDFKSRSGFLAEEKILLQHDTVLDRHMVSAKDALFQAWHSMLTVECANHLGS